jgi:hypothetical protein
MLFTLAILVFQLLNYSVLSHPNHPSKTFIVQQGANASAGVHHKWLRKRGEVTVLKSKQEFHYGCAVQFDGMKRSFFSYFQRANHFCVVPLQLLLRVIVEISVNFVCSQITG